MQTKLIPVALIAVMLATPAMAMPPYDDCPLGTYRASSSHCVPSPNGNCAGATARCRDGSCSHSEHPNASGTCSSHGGVAHWEKRT